MAERIELVTENPLDDARRPTLYVDATVWPPVLGTKTVVFGPFSDRAEAERALTAFIARENAMGAVIRDPDAGRRGPGPAKL